MRLGSFDTVLWTRILGGLLIGLLGGCDSGREILPESAILQVITPSPEGAANEAQPLIRWFSGQSAPTYRVSLYADQAMTQLVEQAEVEDLDHRCQSTLPDNGVFWLRIEGLDSDGNPMMATPLSRFRVRIPPQPMPNIEILKFDPARTQRGYRLFNLFDRDRPDGEPFAGGTLLLINEVGEIVWWWRDAASRSTGDVRVLENTNLLVENMRDNLRRAVEMDWDGNIIWQSREGASVHHEVSVGPQGHTMYLHFVAQDVNGVSYEGDGIEIVNRDTDAVIWTWNSFDHISTDEVDEQDIERDGLSGLGRDWTHSNAVVWDEARSIIWLSVRALDRVIGIDYPSGNIRVTLGENGLGGEGLMSHQHAPEVQEDGSLLLFDNGNRYDPPRSRVTEILWDETAGTVTQPYVFDLPPELLAFALGDADRMPNGNILAVPGTIGRIVEIDTVRQEIVWDMHAEGASVGRDWWIYRAELVQPNEIPDGVLPFDD
ncbi:MAG: aryl-sulfate sulfotransferase [Planctomycetota bacterium]